MARPREFNTTKALQAAVMCFWEQGYEATSMRDLTDRMGISGPSLYAAFGHKRSLFTHVLELYFQTFTCDRIVRLEAALPARARPGAFLAEVIENSTRDIQQRGCLLVNTAIEVAPHDAKISEIVRAHLEQVRAFFERSLVAARSSRAILPDVDCVQAADHLMAVLIGIRVLARTKPLREQLTSIATTALAPLMLGDTVVCQGDAVINSSMNQGTYN